MNNSHTYLSPLCMPLLTTWTWDLLMLSYFWWNLVSNQTERIVLSSSLCFFLCKQPERKWEFQLETATWRSPSPAQQLKSNNVGVLWRIPIDIWTRTSDESITFSYRVHNAIINEYKLINCNRHIYVNFFCKKYTNF